MAEQIKQQNSGKKLLFTRSCMKLKGHVYLETRQIVLPAPPSSSAADLLDVIDRDFGPVECWQS